MLAGTEQRRDVAQEAEAPSGEARAPDPAAADQELGRGPHERGRAGGGAEQQAGDGAVIGC